jgi:hypothetical protein
LLLKVLHFELRRRHVADWLEQPAVIEPVNPLKGCVLDVLEITPRTAMVDDFRLVESDDRFGQGVVVRIPNGAGRGLDADFGQAVKGIPVFPSCGNLNFPTLL